MKRGMQGARSREVALWISLALGVTACGGGGGNVRPAAVSTPAPPPAPATAQPPVDAQLALTHAYAAHSQGFTGQGVTIGVVDSGIMRNHPALAGRVARELVYVDPRSNNTAIDDVVGHGTWVSEIAAGRAFDRFPGGIAPGASLVSARIISDKAPTDDGSGQGNAVGAADAQFFAALNTDLVNAGVRVQNNSWGGIYWNTADATINKAFGTAYDDFVLAHDGLVVFAAGNDSKADPSDIAALPSLAPELEKGWLVAVAADSNHPTRLASYSNACGKAMRYCLTAPGDVIVSGKDDTATSTHYWIVSGTSFAAPQVSGAAALVWQAFPYFDNDLVRQTLLGTADDLGAAGPDKVFGYGMLDVGKAVNGPAKFDWGDVAVDFDGVSVWSNPTSGAGGLTKDGAGTLILTEPTGYAGLTDVLGGTLIARAIGGSLNIQGLVRDTHSVGGNITNSGTLMVSGGDVTVGGDYFQWPGGRLALELGSVLRVAGAAQLSGPSGGSPGADLQVVGAGTGYVANSHTDVIVTLGGLTGTFATLSVGSGVLLLNATLGYDATSAWLDVTQVNASAVPGVTYTVASKEAALRVDGAFSQINAQLAPGAATATALMAGAASLQRTSSVSALQRSLESLSGQLHAASTAMTFEAIDAGTRALSDRFDQLLDAPTAGGWARNLGYHGGMARNGYGNVGYDLDGWLVGQDRRFGANGVAGFAVSQSQGLGQLAESVDQGRSHAVEGMLYGGLVRNQAYLLGRLGVGQFRESMRRQLELGASFSGVASDSNGRYGVAYGEGGYRLALGGLQLTPYADVQYTRIRHDGFRETGGYGFGLQAGAQTIERWQAGAGLRAAHRWGLADGGSLALQGRLSWQQALAMRGDVFDASFTGVNQWAPLGGIGVSRYGGVAGITLDWSAPRRGALQLGLDREVGQRDHATMATLAYRLAF
jgi:autotransporter-associated beta strand protein